MTHAAVFNTHFHTQDKNGNEIGQEPNATPLRCTTLHNYCRDDNCGT